MHDLQPQGQLVEHDPYIVALGVDAWHSLSIGLILFGRAGVQTARDDGVTLADVAGLHTLGVFAAGAPVLDIDEVLHAEGEDATGIRLDRHSREQRAADETLLAVAAGVIGQDGIDDSRLGA